MSQPRWSPDGSRLAFLAAVDGKPQIFVLPMGGGDAWQVTKSPTAIQQYAWRPGGRTIAYVASDEAPKVSGEERHNRRFRDAEQPFPAARTRRVRRTLWLIVRQTARSWPRRLTSGTWTLPVSLPPSAPSSPLSWSPDGKRLAIVKIATPYTGDADKAPFRSLDVESGELRPVTGRTRYESQPVFSPDGRRIAHWYPRDGETRNVNEIYVGPAERRRIRQRDARARPQRAARDLDARRQIPAGERQRRHDTGAVDPASGREGAPHRHWARSVPTAAFWLDASVGPKGEIAFHGSEPAAPGRAVLSWRRPSQAAAAHRFQ